LNGRRERLILAVSFAVFLLINAYLVIIHEPWRDEIHAWLMAKYMSVPEMIEFSRYEAHPLLWHFMLIPLARCGAPVWTMNLLSYLIVAVSAFIFLFKVRWNIAAKIITLFTIPFIYTYSSIARNYCLILLFGMIIAALYSKRYDHPFLYSIPIALMVFTHALAWGLVAGLTITFHIYEIGKFFLRRSELDKRKICLMAGGLAVIAASTVTVIITLYGERNIGYSVEDNSDTDMLIICMIILMAVIAVSVLLRFRQNLKEMITLVISFSFMILVYKTVYSGVLFQRLILIQAFLLIYALTVYGESEENKIKNLINTGVYFLSFIITGSMIDTVYYIANDITSNYSSGREMAEYIDSNLPDEKEILVDAGIFAQTMVPYTDKELHDIRYNANIEDALYCVNEPDKIMAAIYDIPNHDEYRGKYLLLYYAMEGAPFKEIYRTSGSVTGEDYTLYYIP